jgi:CheY-like chemotaxis protein
MKRHPDPETTVLLKELQTEANRAAGITRQLLMFSRRSLLELKVLELNEVIANLLSMLRRLIGGAIEIRFHPGNAIPPVDADPTLIEQVVINIVANARDAMPRGGSLTIATHSVELDANLKRPGGAGVPGRYAVVSLVDTGCGMDYLTLAQMFEPFFTTKPVGQGTGLGLATAHGIIAQHHGWIEAESEPGKGTVIRILLPESKRNRTGAPVPVPAHGGTGHETILLVEDEPAVRRIAARGLRDLGYGVLEASDGPEALAIWQRHQSAIDLLFTDMILPGGLTGSELILRFRSAKPELRTIITSGQLAELAPASDQRQRPDHFLNKPYSLHTLATAVREVLERRTIATQAAAADAPSI